MDETTKWLLKLQYCPGISWKDQYLLFKQDPDLEKISCMTKAEYAQITGRSAQQADLILQKLHSLSFNHLYSSLMKSSSTFIPIYDKKYPKQLKRLPQPPWGLFAMGDVNLLKTENMLAVVGARNGDQYGKEALQSIIPFLIEKKISIVSGLARGIDAFSHELALQAGGKAIAVIAGGFGHFYPRENIQLAQRISKEGLILSEYAPEKRPEKWQFPARNRIVSGLSKGVLVVQAAKKSGSLITAAFALEQGIDVFAVPGPITHPLSEGVHSLIADGAKIVHCADDILMEFQQE
ncbi:DNA-processing protein DprA [Domibacillus iocasae]|uniref:DNA protecting protein DprA n=1 Tax=Domibacillus iocasae TaxID=1714016 RepID=A0A1E7DKL3_9BACI|nr:DNA-processing protein DprA [Domibacillus iocasae]OES43626.1 DNA protecting protein DprA [Domibacillus iocasae]